MMSTHTSGNLLADRRFAMASALASEGDSAAAADLFEQTLELVPEWGPAWLALGLALERTGARAAALAALQRAEAFDRSGELGAALHLARLQGSTPAAMPTAFVATLFDQYADRFDTHLVGSLNYRGPAMISALIQQLHPGRLGSVLDLGCGTGLMARALHDRGDVIDGIDLSPGMIDYARQTGLYRHLWTGDIVAHLKAADEASYRLLVAADVFVYLGDLSGLLKDSARVLMSGGYLAFSVQLLPEGDYRLGADMRFAHGRDYLAGTLADAGFDSITIEEGSTRDDGGTAVPGLLVVARRP